MASIQDFLKSWRLKTSKANRKRKKLKTRNKMLLFISLLIIIYTLLDIILAFISIQNDTLVQLDSTLTSEVFSFGKWALTTGASITITKTLKGENTPEGEENNEY